MEAGVSIFDDGNDENGGVVTGGLISANEYWENATPADVILDDYQNMWSNFFSRLDASQGCDQEIPGAMNLFWIETGYVTKNRGMGRPGNQIDLPRGMSRYFGLNSPEDQPLNSIIGEITFRTPVGDPVIRNIRLGNNSMKK